MCQSQINGGVLMSEEVHSRGDSDDTSSTDCATLLSELASKIRRSCAGQRAHVSTPSVGPWRIVATDRPGLPHLPLLCEADIDAHYVEATSLADCRRRSAPSFDYDGHAAEA